MIIFVRILDSRFRGNDRTLKGDEYKPKGDEYKPMENLNEQKLDSLMQENDEIIAVIVASIKTARKHKDE